MNTEVGKVYKTRNGQTATVEREQKDEPIYPFYGKVLDDEGNVDRIAYWTSNGRYSADHPTEFDLVATLN